MSIEEYPQTRYRLFCKVSDENRHFACQKVKNAAILTNAEKKVDTHVEA